MCKTVIVEDELNARQLLRRYLEKYCDLKILEEAETFEQGVNAILEFKPDIVFLDISLGAQNGFDLLKQFPYVDFEVIFVTAFDEFAIQAIRLSAVDYLLKPIDIVELKAAVERAKEKIVSKRISQNLLLLLENLDRNELSKKIAIPDGHSYIYEQISNIIRLRAQGRYTEIFTSAGKKYTVTRNLGEFDKMLAPYKFLRVHHSHLVNSIHISSFEKKDGGFLIMRDNSYVEVSRKNREELVSFLKRL